MRDQSNSNQLGSNPICANKKSGPAGIVARKSGQVATYENRTSGELVAGSNNVCETKNLESLPSEKKSLLKALAHKLPHPVLVRAFLLKYALNDLRIEHKARVKNELIPFDELNLSKFKKSGTVFMLGSGPSINGIPKQRWDAIARHDSMACNFWLFHNFVPTFYFYEAIGCRDGKLSEVFRRVAEKRAKEYAHCIKVVTGLGELAPDFDLFRPGAWAHDLYTISTIPVAARNEREFMTGLRLVRSLGLFGRSERIKYIFKQASSITGLISLAVRMGYNRIVLCGVDLQNGEYFYQDPELYADGAEVEFQARNAPHKLVTSQPWKILTDAAVEIMTREILEPAGVKIYVESRSSRLWPAISEAPESLFR
jgi:hypothetical protein